MKSKNDNKKKIRLVTAPSGKARLNARPNAYPQHLPSDHGPTGRRPQYLAHFLDPSLFSFLSLRNNVFLSLYIGPYCDSYCLGYKLGPDQSEEKASNNCQSI